MALRPEDVVGHEFVPEFRGYRRDEVRSFLRVVAAELEARHDDARRSDDARLSRIELLLETLIADRRPSTTEVRACNILLYRTLDELNSIRSDMIEIQRAFDFDSEADSFALHTLDPARSRNDSTVTSTAFDREAATTHVRIPAGSPGA